VGDLPASHLSGAAPGIVAGLLYAFIMSFGDVPISIFLVNSDTMTFPVLAFQDMQADFNPGMLAVSTIVVVAAVYTGVAEGRRARSRPAGATEGLGAVHLTVCINGRGFDPGGWRSSSPAMTSMPRACAS
jgi:hypothetical protein